MFARHIHKYSDRKKVLFFHLLYWEVENKGQPIGIAIVRSMSTLRWWPPQEKPGTKSQNLHHSHDFFTDPTEAPNYFDCHTRIQGKLIACCLGPSGPM